MNASLAFNTDTLNRIPARGSLIVCWKNKSCWTQTNCVLNDSLGRRRVERRYVTGRNQRRRKLIDFERLNCIIKCTFLVLIYFCVVCVDRNSGDGGVEVGVPTLCWVVINRTSECIVIQANSCGVKLAIRKDLAVFIQRKTSYIVKCHIANCQVLVASAEWRV